jgi:hypothetical protein
VRIQPFNVVLNRPAYGHPQFIIAFSCVLGETLCHPTSYLCNAGVVQYCTRVRSPRGDVSAGGSSHVNIGHEIPKLKSAESSKSSFIRHYSSFPPMTSPTPEWDRLSSSAKSDRIAQTRSSEVDKQLEGRRFDDAAYTSSLCPVPPNSTTCGNRPSNLLSSILH